MTNVSSTHKLISAQPNHDGKPKKKQKMKIEMFGGFGPPFFDPDYGVEYSVVTLL